MKNIWCTFKAGSLNWEKKLSAKTVLKIIQDLFLPTYDTFLPTTKQADAHAVNLQCFDHVCNLLFIICHCPEIFLQFLKK